MSLDASSARKITRSNLRGPVVEPFVTRIDKAIEAAASNGESVIHVDHALRDYKRPTQDEEHAIRRHYESLGYVWMDHPSPDPGHYASRPYSTISW